MARENRGRLIIISAPSGSGKGTVIQRILTLRPDIVFSVSATTRAPRPGEQEGISYRFVTPERFKEMIANDDFLEYAEYVGEFYGTPKMPIYESLEAGKDVLLDIEVNGASQVLAKIPDAETIFIIPPDMEELERRLRGRGTDGEEKLKARLERARQELEERSIYRHTVKNDTVKRAAAEIVSIINCYERK